MEYISKEHLEIRRLCKMYNIHDFKINHDGSIDTNQSVYLNNMNLDKIPIKFNKVKGNFNCSYNKLTTLENSPKNVETHFLCDNNLLTDLKHSPYSIGGFFQCDNNPLESLDGYNGSMDRLYYNGMVKLIRKETLKKILDDRY